MCFYFRQTRRAWEEWGEIVGQVQIGAKMWNIWSLNKISYKRNISTQHQTVFLSQLKSFGRLGQKINISTRFTLCTLVTFERARSWKWQIGRGNFCVMSLWQIAMGSDKTQDASFENLVQNVVFCRERNNSTNTFNLPLINISYLLIPSSIEIGEPL